ncbi:MAG: hypothetical protein M3Y71_18400 [Actinomycetota bacterium]|nr:hypothetical protein [Actinomycetota bacterium]
MGLPLAVAPDLGRRLQVVADLDLEISDDHGVTSARLTSGDGLRLEVADAAVLLRCLPGGGLHRLRPADLPQWLPLEQVADLPVSLTSHGRPIGRLWLSPSGRLRFAPAWTGIPTIARTATSYGAGRLDSRAVLYVAAGVMVVAVALATGRRLRL